MNSIKTKVIAILYIPFWVLPLTAVFIILLTWIIVVFMAIFHLEGSNYESMLTITNCLFSNNTSGGNILEITSNGLHMSNIHLISNKIKWIEYSIIQTTAIIFHPHERNLCNNNTGTGLKLKDVTVSFNNIRFYNNTGVYGGGMSLYHTIIYLTGPLIFERNTALFGGAIILQQLRYFTIHNVLHLNK